MFDWQATCVTQQYHNEKSMFLNPLVDGNVWFWADDPRNVNYLRAIDFLAVELMLFFLLYV